MQKATAHVVDFFRNMWADIVDFFPKALDKMIELMGAFTERMVVGFGMVIIDFADKINWLIEGLNKISPIDIDPIDTDAISKKFASAGETIKNSMGGAMDKIVADVKIATDIMRGDIDADVAAIDKASAKKTVLVLKFYEEWKKGYLKTNKENEDSTQKLADNSLKLWEIYWAKVKAGAIGIGGGGDPSVDPPAVGGGGKEDKKDPSGTPKATNVPAPNLSAFQSGLEAMKTSWGETWDSLTTTTDKDGQVIDNSFGKTVANIVGLAGKMGKMMVGIGDAVLNKRLANIDEERKSEYAKLDAMGLGAEEYAKRKEKIDDDMMDKTRAAKEKHKKWAVAEVLINTAIAIVKGYSQLGPILGTVAAIMLAATAAIQIATINAQTFAKGGIVKGFAGGGSAGYGTDTVPAMLTPGEYVMKKSVVDKYGTGFFEKLNKFQEGGSVSNISSGDAIAKNITVNIQAVDSKSFYEWVASNPEGLSRAIQIIDERGFIDVNSSTGAITSQFGTGGL